MWVGRPVVIKRERSLNNVMEILMTIHWQAMFQIGLSALLGGMIGLERESRGRDAGFRTNMLIAMGSCLFTILSITAFPQKGAAQDTARVAAQIVTGVGFLGAAALFQTRRHTKGITTAASIWIVAAIGMAVGAKVYDLAIFTTLAAFATLRWLRPVSKRLQMKEGFDQDGSEDDL